MINSGDEVTIFVKGIVTKVSDSHGLCYRVELPQRDYSEKRVIWLDEDEIKNHNLTTPVDTNATVEYTGNSLEDYKKFVALPRFNGFSIGNITEIFYREFPQYK